MNKKRRLRHKFVYELFREIYMENFIEIWFPSFCNMISARNVFALIRREKPNWTYF